MKFGGIFLLLIFLKIVCSEDNVDPDRNEAEGSYSNITIKNILEDCEDENCIRICNKSLPLTKFSVSVENEEFMVIDLVIRNFTIKRAEPECLENQVLVPLEPYEFIENGSIAFLGDLYQVNEYCFNIISDNETEVLGCLDSLEESHIHQLYTIGMMISLPFLIITFLVYACIPELHSLHGKNFLSYVFSLALFYASNIFSQFREHQESDLICRGVGYIIYFSGLACFFWLNIMCIEIWITTRATHLMSKRFDTAKFLGFSAYAFGVPLLLTGFAALVDNTDYFGSLVAEDYHPSVGKQIDINEVFYCTMSKDSKVRLLYMYSIFQTLMILNLIIFGMTAWNIYMIKKGVRNVRHQNSQSPNIKRFFLYLRLFVLMGIVWIMEPISWIVGENNFIFYVTDILNCLQGLIIFFLFVIRGQVLKFLKSRYDGIMSGISQLSLTSSGTTSSQL